MPATEEHFAGLDPRPGPNPCDGCPAYKGPAFVIWYEMWGFTWKYYPGFRPITYQGIGYTHAFRIYNVVGQDMGTVAVRGLTTCLFNRLWELRPLDDPPTHNDMLRIARAHCAHLRLPPPGTTQYTPEYLEVIGYGS